MEDVLQLESGILTEFLYRDKLLGRPAEVLFYLAEIEPRLLVGLSCDVLYVFRVDAGPVVRFHNLAFLLVQSFAFLAAFFHKLFTSCEGFF